MPASPPPPDPDAPHATATTAAQPTPTSAPTTTQGGKRKRAADTASPAASPAKASARAKAPPPAEEDDRELAERRKAVVAAAAGALLGALKEFDPPPPCSILSYTLPTPENESSPPKKRSKTASPPPPTTLAARLEGGYYETFAPLLADIADAAREVLKKDAADEQRTRVSLFESFAVDLITRERVKHADIFDFVDELDEGGDTVPATSSAANSTSGTLTVITSGGMPLFTSLAKPERVPVPGAALSTTSSSRESSTASGSPSTAPTSAPSVGASTEEVEVPTPLPECTLPPQISLSLTLPTSISGGKRATLRVPTLSEACPPYGGGHAIHPPPPITDKPLKIGLTWGGAYGPYGVLPPRNLDERTEPAGNWLKYRNHPDYVKKWPHEPFRKGIGLPPDFVAAYSSFAPTRDDSMAKVPSHVRNSIWWERRGRRKFEAMDVNRRREALELDEGELARIIDEWVDEPTEPAEPVKEVPADVIDPALETAEKMDVDASVSTDAALTNGDGDAAMSSPTPPAEPVIPLDTTATLTELSTLLTQLRSEQFQRLLTPTYTTPTDAELKLYDTLTTRFVTLLATLPPHLAATITGDPAAPLAVSRRIPVAVGAPLRRGNLPAAAEPHPVPTGSPAVQGAATAALNAAAGLSPVAGSVAPVANMMRATPVRSSSRGHTAPQTAPQLARQGSSGYGYAGAQPQAQTPAPTGRTRSQAPPGGPQGLAAAGVGVQVGGGLRMAQQHTQGSMSRRR